MPNFKIYAGLSGGFGGANYHGTYEFRDQKEAEKYAYDLAWEEYESYGGYHGLLTWDDVYDDCLASEWIDPESMSEGEIESVVDDAYIEQVESWITWRVVEVSRIIPYDEEDDDDDYCDDDSDCYCD